MNPALLFLIVPILIVLAVIPQWIRSRRGALPTSDEFDTERRALGDRYVEHVPGDWNERFATK